MEWLNRTLLCVGEDGLKRLQSAHVLVVGLGGVGAYAAEMICRAGVGRMTIVDADKVDITNINRQLPALLSNVGKLKAEVLAERFRDINPNIELTVICQYIKDESIDELLTTPFDYVVDAIDTLAPKVNLIATAYQLGYPLVSSMGAGGKMNPALVQVADLSKSYNCPLARFIRKRLSKKGIRKGFKVVFSPEDIPDEAVRIEESANKKSAVGTISYMPALFGIHCASVVITDLLKSNPATPVPSPEI